VSRHRSRGSQTGGVEASGQEMGLGCLQNDHNN
jgi:hypothetical protein